MRGWEFTTTNVPLKLIEKPDPVAKPGYVVIDVKAAGLCHSDVSALEHESWLAMMTPPVIMGHEYAGVITAIGEGVTGYKIGDRVGVCPLGAKDGTSPGYTRDGGYATMSTAPVETLIPVPDAVNFAQAAAATDAGMTSRHALCVTGGIQPGMKVGIIGVGGLGQIATRISVVKGCETYVATRKKEAQEMALALGCKEAANNIMELADKKLDVIVDFAGAGTTTAQAIEAIGPGGTVVIVGMSKDYSEICTMSMIMKQVTFKGSIGGNVDDIRDCYDLMASGKLDPVLTRINFEEIGAGIDMLRDGKVKGRLVALRD
ncbi:MAG: zinc-binding dehydrogenase [Oscillospiraceae bacterium]|nr:zinc-binding dehydrogenase [Oscillospiraceae bacterium]